MIIYVRRRSLERPWTGTTVLWVCTTGRSPETRTWPDSIATAPPVTSTSDKWKRWQIIVISFTLITTCIFLKNLSVCRQVVLSPCVVRCSKLVLFRWSKIKINFLDPEWHKLILSKNLWLKIVNMVQIKTEVKVQGHCACLGIQYLLNPFLIVSLKMRGF